MLLAVDCFALLVSASLRDFQFVAVTNYEFNLFFGLFTAGATNLEIVHAAPGPLQPYAAVQPGGEVAFSNVPHKLRGTGAYEANDFVCQFLIDSGVPCQDVIDLAERTTSPITSFPGTLSLSNGVLRFLGSFRFGPVPVAPGTTLSGSAIVAASGNIQPCLDIRLGDLPNEHLVSWSSAFEGFTLFRAASLKSPIQWEPTQPLFISDDGSTVSAVLRQAGGSGFYRLSRE